MRYRIYLRRLSRAVGHGALWDQLMVRTTSDGRPDGLWALRLLLSVAQLANLVLLLSEDLFVLSLCSESTLLGCVRCG